LQYEVVQEDEDEDKDEHFIFFQVERTAGCKTIKEGGEDHQRRRRRAYATRAPPNTARTDAHCAQPAPSPFLCKLNTCGEGQGKIKNHREGQEKRSMMKGETKFNL